MPKKTIVDPMRIAAEIAREPIDLTEVYGRVLEHKRFKTLIAALIDELPDHFQERVLTLDQETEMYDRVRAGLSEDLQGQLLLLTSWSDIEHSVCQEASFLLGVAVGQQLGGAQ